jgi:hypothetical protein
MVKYCIRYGSSEHAKSLSFANQCEQKYTGYWEARKMQKDGEVGDRNLDLPQSARCKADALPLSYI